MDEFEESLVKLGSINQIIDQNERNSVFNSIDQLFSSSAFFTITFQTFNELQTDTGKVSLLKNMEYWINYNWEQIIEEGHLDDLRTFLFETLPSIQSSQNQRVSDAISMTQARFCQRILPQWSDFFNQTFFDEAHFQIAISFILAMCKMLSMPLYNERPEIIEFRNALIQDGKSNFFQQFIFQGISQAIPNAFIALGYFSICFDNTWISNEELFQAFGSGMENPSTSSNTLEAINLILQSNFDDEVKVNIVTSLNLIEVIIAGSEDDNILGKYSEIIYSLIQIFPIEHEIYQTLVDIAINFLPKADYASLYACLALTSALNKNVSDKSDAIVSQCLLKLRTINEKCSTFFPSELAQYHIELIKKAIYMNIQDSWSGFQSFLATYQEDMENQGTSITVLQFIYNFRLLMPTFKELIVEDITEEILSIFSEIYAGEQSEFDEKKKYIASTYYQCLLTPPIYLIPEESQSEYLGELFLYTISFIRSECVPNDLSEFILASTLPSMYIKKLSIPAETILQLLQGDPFILTIIGKLTNAINASQAQIKLELINQIVSNMAELINSDPAIQRTQFFNLSYFFSAFSLPIIDPELCQTIVEFIHGIITNPIMQYDDGVIGNYLAISWVFGDAGFALFNEIADAARQPNGVNGLCRSILYFIKYAGTTQCTCEYKQIVLQPEWQVEKFVFIFERVSQLYNDFIHYNYNFKNTKAYCSMFSSFFKCMTCLYANIDDEQYQAFFTFAADYLTRLSCLPEFLSNAYEFFNFLAANKKTRQGFDPIALLEPIHSFLFSPKFNIHMYTCPIPKFYPNLLTNLSKLHYQEFAEGMKGILVQFQMSDEFSSEFLKQFEGSETSITLAVLLEEIIRKRTFALHPQ